MRIVAGNLGGRAFESPSGHRTHPMSEKVRGALFNALGDITNLTILDAFAGSGALSFEAISRGAAHATTIDIDKSAITTIVNNARLLKIEGKIKAIRANVSTWSNNNPDAQFDAVLCDPPYDNVNPLLITKLANHAKAGGIIIFSLPPMSDFSLPRTDYRLLSTKRHGDAKLLFYRRYLPNS